MELRALNQQIKACTNCPLRETATAPVCGIGSVGAKYFVIGEAPGAEEDRKGVPFIGQAGKKLDKLIDLAKINPNDIYITNTVRCRPPSNNKPKKKIIRECSKWLWRELEIVNPQYIITLGAVPLSLFSPYGISRMHGTVLKHGAHQVIAQYHPAAALHNPRLWAVMLGDWETFPIAVPHDYTVRPETARPPPIFAIDTETSGIGEFSIGDWSIAYRDTDGRLVVQRYNGVRKDKQWDDATAIMHNAKWDLRVLRANGMEEPTDVHDTMICAYCLGYGYQAPTDDTKEQSGNQMVGGLGLKYLARKHLGMEMKEWNQVKDHPEMIPAYNDADSIATYLLWEKWKDILPKHYFEIDKPLLHVLMDMEDKGVAVDSKYLRDYAEELQGKLAKIELPLNPNATQELQSYIYGTLGVEPWKFTDKGQPSVDADVLESLDDPICNSILEYKSLSKEISTYTDNYIQGSMLDGRIHPEFKQVRTATGRLSCASPNLQNVPTENISSIRKVFVAKAGCKLVVADYSQIELRVLAAITQDPIMLEAFHLGRDIHDETLTRMKKYLPKMVRRDAKIINFLTSFGGTPWKISLEFDIPIDEARQFQKDYFQEFTGIAKYIIEQKRIANIDRKVTLWTGRTRRLDDMFAPDWRVQQKGEREAINTPIQGGAGEIVKIGMCDLHYKHHLPMVLQVHDEIIAEVPTRDAEECAHWLYDYLPNLTILGGLNFPVDVGIGDNWYDAKDDAERRKKERQ